MSFTICHLMLVPSSAWFRKKSLPSSDPIFVFYQVILSDRLWPWLTIIQNLKFVQTGIRTFLSYKQFNLPLCLYVSKLHKAKKFNILYLVNLRVFVTLWQIYFIKLIFCFFTFLIPSSELKALMKLISTCHNTYAGGQSYTSKIPIYRKSINIPNLVHISGFVTLWQNN